MKVLRKKKKIPRENPSYLFSSKKPNLKVGLKKKKISWRPREEPERCQAPAETDAGWGRRRVILGVSGNLLGVSGNLLAEQHEDDLGATMLFTLVIKATLCSCGCLELPDTTRLGVEAPTSASPVPAVTHPGEPTAWKRFRPAARRRCGEGTQRGFFQERPSDGGSAPRTCR